MSRKYNIGIPEEPTDDSAKRVLSFLMRSVPDVERSIVIIWKDHYVSRYQEADHYNADYYARHARYREKLAR